MPYASGMAAAFGKKMKKGISGGWLKRVLVGEPRDISGRDVFKSVSLVPVLAWIGLGADGLSSSCYGPEESFKALGGHIALAPLIALACILTIAVICASYSQIIEAFPGGGGGYLVASKLLSPATGAVSGCALLIDYVLTIAISVASGSDALFSMLPPALQPWKLAFSIAVLGLLTLINLRGVKESVLIWTPVFFIFIATHGIAIAYAAFSHFGDFSQAFASSSADLKATSSQLGLLGILALLVHSYSVGAGTYTGIEAVSNGLPILREPRVATGKRTMLYMGVSLAIMVGGLLLAYLLCHVEPKEGMTLNAVLFAKLSSSWAWGGGAFSWAAMLSAAALLFIAAQTGFLDGPRVLANMASDRWFPSRFALLSDRLVAQNGILLMGAASLFVLCAASGSVALLVVLYSINVFITFTLSQAGMVRHWWRERKNVPGWKSKLALNGVGVLMTGFILLTLCFVKFWEGGWITLLATGLLVGAAFMTRSHYRRVQSRLSKLDSLAPALSSSVPSILEDGKAETGTAAIFVNGFNGLGLHTLLGVGRIFPRSFGRYVFVQVGLVDAGNFKGASELERLKAHLEEEAGKYVAETRRQGYEACSFNQIGCDFVQTAEELAGKVRAKYPNAVFFGGQLVFKEESIMDRLLHNYAIFAIQKELYKKGMPLVIMPIKV